MNPVALIGAGLALNGAAAAIAARLGSVDAGGAVTGAIIGAVIFVAGGPLFWCILGAFFLSSTALGRLGRKRKQLLEALHEKGGKRDYLQVLANGGIGMIMALAYRITGNPAWALGFAASFASSSADTWAGEVGVLSRKDPVSVLTLRPVTRGISGGISLLGSIAALGGALFVALLFWAAVRITGLPLADFLPIIAIVSACGFAGSFVDSFLGATLQAQYASREHAAGAESAAGAPAPLTEKRLTHGVPNRLVRGLPFVTNDVVNLASCAIAAAAGVLLHPLVA